MTVRSNFSAIRGVPFGKLFLSPHNVRKDNSEEGIEELADSIAIEGILQNLAGHEGSFKTPKGKCVMGIGVTAGQRRWRGLQVLKKRGVIDDKYIVPCLITSIDAAIAVSLAENKDRKDLHPADEFEAARALMDAGQSIDQVAERLRLSPLTVQRRLKLANVAPQFIQLYREGVLTLEHLMAFAITEDHERQEQVWKGLSPHSRTASQIRQALTETEMAAKNPLARFVTVKAYEKAGGKCRHDMFTEEVFLLDVKLLEDLAQKKLAKAADKLKEEGQGWVDVSPRVDFADRAGYGRVALTMGKPNKKDLAKLDGLDRESTEIDTAWSKAEAAEGGMSDDLFEELEQRREEIQKERDALQDKLLIPNPEQLAKSGTLLSIDRDGKLKVEKALLRAADAKLFAAQSRRESKDGTDEAPRNHSVALLQRVTAHRTLALRAVFAQNPEVALATVVHRFVLNAFGELGCDGKNPLKVVTPEVYLSSYADDLKDTPAHTWLEAQRTHLRGMFPADPKDWFQWIVGQTYAEKLALLAFCASRTLNAVQMNEGESDADPLAKALQIDLRKWWTPTAQGYFNCVPKSVMLQAVTEGASSEAAAKVETLKKKKPMAQEAEKALSGKGWVPHFLRAAWVPNGSDTASA